MQCILIFYFSVWLHLNQFLYLISGGVLVFVVLKAGVISQARGSAYIEQNETKVMCAV